MWAVLKQRVGIWLLGTMVNVLSLFSSTWSIWEEVWGILREGDLGKWGVKLRLLFVNMLAVVACKRYLAISWYKSHISPYERERERESMYYKINHNLRTPLFCIFHVIWPITSPIFRFFVATATISNTPIIKNTIL